MSTIYFTDSLFSAGMTEIYNENKDHIGNLDLKSAFTSSVDILNTKEEITLSGGFRFFSRTWVISQPTEEEVGEVKQRFSFFAKKFEYEAFGRGVYTIESEAFSRQYEIHDEQEQVIAQFNRTDSFFESPAFCLTNHSSVLAEDELIAVIMGVNMIQKRNSSGGAAGAAAT
ncbi:hypothetical protein [Pontibacillus yanchengensis]|uniref:hypothetical protein n=1 Tax=Pontibacillus yanchengensis TaxID=462910 RepID=UPI000560454C|nr:hypothetical protein [Pontibacillus yanchengensis]